MELHEVPHDPGAGHQVVIEGELVSVLAGAEHEAGALAVVTADQRRLSERDIWVLELT